MAFDFSADHIAAGSGSYEPQRLNHFEVTFANIGSTELVQKCLRSFEPPHREIDAVEIPYANENRKVAGRVSVTDANMVIGDYCDKDSWKAFHDWLNLVHNVATGAIGMAKDYKKDGTVSYYGPNGELKRSWTCQGCWPKSVSPEQFSMESNEQNTLTVPLACDKVKPADGQ